MHVDPDREPSEGARDGDGFMALRGRLGAIAEADKQDRLAASIYTTLDVPPPAYNGLS